MSIICYDSQGKILKKLYQWDMNQFIKVRGLTIPVVSGSPVLPMFHFSYDNDAEAKVVVHTSDNGYTYDSSTNTVSVPIPNIVLRSNGYLNVYTVQPTDANDDSTYEGKKVTFVIRFPVVKRARPSDYNFIDNIDYDTVEELLDKFPIKYGDLALSLQNIIDGKYKYEYVTTGFDADTDPGIIYEGTIDGIEYKWITVGRGANNKAQFRFSKNGIEWRKRESGTWGEWQGTDIPDDSIGWDNLTTALQTKIDGKFDFVDVSLQTSTIFDSTVVLGKIYHGTISGVEYLWWNVEGSSSSDKTQFRWSKNGIEWRKKESGTWGSWSYAIPNGSVKWDMLANDAQNIIDGKFNYRETSGFYAQQRNGYIGHTTVDGVEYLYFNVENYDTADKSQFRWSKNGMERRKTENGTWGEWQGTDIPDGSITYGMLSTNLQGIIDGKADLTDLDELLRYFPYTINTASQLNISGYASEYGRYGLKLVGSAANSFGVESGTLAEMKVIGAGEVSAQNPFIRVLEFPQISGLKWYQEVTSIGQTFTAGSWIKNDVKDNVLLNPDYSIGFASDGTVITRANVTDIGAGSGIGNSNVRSIYVASKATSISSSIISATIGLTTDTLDLYIDNSQNDINIASEILSDNRITIHYRGEFSVIDLLSKSQKELNDRLTELENTVGTANTNLQNALNGVV